MAADLTPATDAEIAEAERLHAAATPGEWVPDIDSRDGEEEWTGKFLVERSDGSGTSWGSYTEPSNEPGAVVHNARAAASAHNLLPGLIARLRAAEAANAALRDDAETNAGLLAQYEAADLGKHPDAEALLKSALGPDWSRHWGPTLEALGRAVDAVLHARDRMRERGDALAAAVDAVVRGMGHSGGDVVDLPCNDSCVGCAADTVGAGHRSDLPMGACADHPDALASTECWRCTLTTALAAWREGRK